MRVLQVSSCVLALGAVTAEIGPYRGQSSDTLHHSGGQHLTGATKHRGPFHSGLGNKIRSAGNRLGGSADRATDEAYDAKAEAQAKADRFGRNVRETGREVRDGTAHAADKAGDNLSRAGDSIARGTSRAGDSVARGASRVGDSVSRGAHKVGHGVHQAGHNVKHGVYQAGHNVKHGVHQAGHNVKEGVKDVGHSVHETAHNVKEGLKPRFLNRVDSLFVAQIIFAGVVGLPLLLDIVTYRNIQSSVNNLLGQGYNHLAVETAYEADNVVYKLLGAGTLAAGIRAFFGIQSNDSGYRRSLLDTNLVWSGLTFAVTLYAKLTQENGLYLPWALFSGLFLLWDLVLIKNWHHAQQSIRTRVDYD